jgi:3-(methylthio)propionyl---CoA ligase
MTLSGQMMDQPLLISGLLEHAARHHGTTEIVSRRTEGDTHRYTYADCLVRSKRLAQALTTLGVDAGERIGTLAWNGHRHMEIYFGVSGVGAVCHTINPRLFPEQIAYIINHADDRLVFFDTTFAPLVDALVPHCPKVKGWIVMTDRAHMPAMKMADTSVGGAMCYEELLVSENGNFSWPVFDERAASSLCYTSGTTGNPKGALYSHRSTVLHAYASAVPDAMSISAKDVILPVVPMFHVNAWGIPYSAPMVGAKLVFPGARLDGASIYELFETEGVTMSAGVPTVWLGLLQHVKQNKLKFSTFNRTVIGGSACPPAMMKAFEEMGVEVVHAWGMTELSPLGTIGQLKAKHFDATAEQKRAVREKQGRGIYGIDMKIVDAEGKDLPWDGKAFGDLLVRGPWVISRYYEAKAGDSGGSPLVDGWFPTGDVATIDPDGYMQITDRSKDVIKSGGEWISSIDIENVAAAHPAVQMAACIAVAHAKWDERPMLVVVKKAGVTTPDAELKAELLAFFEGKVAKWWTPDDVRFVTEIPLTATGKMQKLKLREQFKDVRLG